MAIPGIKIEQSALESYKALNSNFKIPKKTTDKAQQLLNESAGFVRKPFTQATQNIDNKAAISYAVSHGTPEEVAKSLDIII